MFVCSLAAAAVVLAAVATPALAHQQSDRASLERTASQAMAERRFDDAAAAFQAILKVSPNDTGALTGLGQALIRSRHPKEAIAALDRAVRLDPTLIAAHALLGSTYLAAGAPALAVEPLERVIKARPGDVETRRRLAEAYRGAGRPLDALRELRQVTVLAPKLASGWYELGQAYNAVGQESMATLAREPEDSPWRQLAIADALLARGPLPDAFFVYRDTLEKLPAMVSIHDSIAEIYEKTDHHAWAIQERAQGSLTPAACASRRALCEFRAGRYKAAFDAALAQQDVESLYWRVRAGAELARAAFNHLEALPDGAERRAIRATRATAEERFTDAVEELQAALRFAPGLPALVFELASAEYAARDYEKALATLAPLREAQPDDVKVLSLSAHALLALRRPDEAIPLLQRALELAPGDPTNQAALGSAFLQRGSFAEAAPLIEAQLPGDRDGSLHVQLARAYTALGRREEAAALLSRSRELQQAAEERRKAQTERVITPPK
jgi:predicted Zn-dependent protease